MENIDDTKNNQLTNTNTDLNSDSDSEEFIDIEDLIKQKGLEQLDIYQLQINFDKLVLKKIGKEHFAPDIIIKENFGPNKNMNLYSCVYTDEELFENLTCNQIFFPLVKLVINSSSNDIITYSIAVLFNNLHNLEDIDRDNITDFMLYFVYNKKNEERVHTTEIEKNINSDNIIEKLIEHANIVLE